MKDRLATYVPEGLPEFCYGTMPSTNETIIIKRGEEGYYPTANQLPASELNERLGITKAQAEAMLVGSIFGWYVNGANPKNYDENGKFSSEKLEDEEGDE